MVSDADCLPRNMARRTCHNSKLSDESSVPSNKASKLYKFIPNIIYFSQALNIRSELPNIYLNYLLFVNPN